MTLCGAAQVSTAEGPGTLPGTKILASSRAEGPGALTAPPGRAPGRCAAQHLRFWAGVRRRCPGPKTQHLPEHHWDNVRFWAHMHWRCAPTVLALHASAVQVSAVQVGVPVLSPHLPEDHRDHVRCGAGVRDPSPPRPPVAVEDPAPAVWASVLVISPHLRFGAGVQGRRPRRSTGAPAHRAAGAASLPPRIARLAPPRPAAPSKIPVLFRDPSPHRPPRVCQRPSTCGLPALCRTPSRCPIGRHTWAGVLVIF